MEDVKLPSYITTVLAVIGAALGGFILKTGLVTADQLPALGGAALVALTAAWRLYSKMKTRQIITDAVAAPAGKAKPTGK